MNSIIKSLSSVYRQNILTQFKLMNQPYIMYLGGKKNETKLPPKDQPGKTKKED